MKVSTLKKNPANPRQITGDKLDKLKQSVAGFQKMMALRPMIVDENNVVIGGNMRLVAIKALGLKEIPDEWVKFAHDLTPDERAQFIITDNSGFGEYDWDEIANSWTDYPLSDWGLDVPDFEAVDDGELVDAEPQIDKAAELNKKWQVKSGDLWVIGEHRLVCGDSTSPQDVSRVLDGAKPHLCVTDPPYGVNYDPQWRSDAAAEGHLAYAASRVGVVENDDRSDWGDAWALFPGDVIYSWHPPGATSLVHAKALQDSGFNLRMQIIWGKSNFPIGRGDYHVRHEPCWYAVRDKKPAKRNDDRTQTTLWNIDLDKNCEGGHSTQKPLECMARPIRNHSGDVYEPFAGSGTTLVACENLNRKCYAIEISENYCAVILERMTQAFPHLEIKCVEIAHAEAVNA